MVRYGSDGNRIVPGRAERESMERQLGTNLIGRGADPEMNLHQVQRIAIGLPPNPLPSPEKAIEDLCTEAGVGPVIEPNYPESKYTSMYTKPIYEGFVKFSGNAEYQDVEIVADADADGIGSAITASYLLKTEHPNWNVNVRFFDQSRGEDNAYYRSPGTKEDFRSDPAIKPACFVDECKKHPNKKYFLLDWGGTHVAKLDNVFIIDHHYLTENGKDVTLSYTGKDSPTKERVHILPAPLDYNGSKISFCTSEMTRGVFEFAYYDSKERHRYDPLRKDDLCSVLDSHPVYEGGNQREEMKFTWLDVFKAFGDLGAYCDKAAILLYEKLRNNSMKGKIEDVVSGWTLNAGTVLSQFATGLAKEIRSRHGEAIEGKETKIFTDASYWLEDCVIRYLDESQTQSGLMWGGADEKTPAVLLRGYRDIENRLRKGIEEPDYVANAWKTTEVNDIIRATIYGRHKGVKGLEDAVEGAGLTIPRGLYLIRVHEAYFDPNVLNYDGGKVSSGIDQGIVASTVKGISPFAAETVDRMLQDAGSNASEFLEPIYRNAFGINWGKLGETPVFAVKNIWKPDGSLDCGQISVRTEEDVLPDIKGDFQSAGILKSERFGGSAGTGGGRMTPEQVDAGFEWFIRSAEPLNYNTYWMDIWVDPKDKKNLIIARETEEPKAVIGTRPMVELFKIDTDATAIESVEA